MRGFSDRTGVGAPGDLEPRASCEGRYEVIAELASGGMATTFVARKTAGLGVLAEDGFERLVVLKRVHPHLCREPNLREMLVDEARVAAAIRHPNVVTVEDVVEDAGELCLVMPYVESLSLGALLEAARASGEPIAPAVASRILLDVLAGLEGAHEAVDLSGAPLEIVHRDVSPRNVLCGVDGRARLIDFGVAKASRRLTRTESGIMKGTIAYMAPEQLRRREVDRRADVFAAGVVLHEAIAGARLFDGKDEADVLVGVLADEIPRLSGVVEGAPAALDEALERALSRDPEERFPSAAAFAEALERALPPAPAREVSALVTRLGEAELRRRREAIRAFADRPRTNPGAAPARRRSSRAFVLFAVAAALSGAGGVALFAVRQPEPPAPSTIEALAPSVRDRAAIVATNAARATSTSEAAARPERSPLPAASATTRAGVSAASAPALRRARPGATAAGRSDLQRNPYRTNELGDNRLR